LPAGARRRPLPAARSPSLPCHALPSHLAQITGVAQTKASESQAEAGGAAGHAQNQGASILEQAKAKAKEAGHRVAEACQEAQHRMQETSTEARNRADEATH
jgi:hypothetical protein